MPRITTDDAARGLTYVWLGPPGHRAWWDWSWPQWFTGAGVLAAAQVVNWWLKPNLLVWLLAALFVCPAIAYAGGALAGRLSRNKDTGLAYQVRTLAAEVRAPRPRPDVVTVETRLPESLFLDYGRSDR